jgi:acyl-CoA thioester hydrolase
LTQERPEPLPRSAFRVFRPMMTRWSDNDAYGHVNNVVYYSYFDSAVNGWLIDEDLLDIASSPVIGYVVSTSCSYFESISFPDPLEAGIAVTRLGRSSVEYAIGIFRTAAPLPVAQGHFVHAYVERTTRRPVEIPQRVREKLATLLDDRSPVIPGPRSGARNR